MVTIWGPQIRRIPFESDAFQDNLMFRFLFPNAPPTEGQVVRFRKFHIDLAEYVDSKAVVKKVYGHGEVEIETIMESRPGMVTTILLDSRFRVVEMTSVIGEQSFHKQLVVCDRELKRPEKAPETSAAPLVFSDVDIGDPHALVRARYRIEELPEAVENNWFEGPGQRLVGKVTKGKVVLEVVRLDEPPLHSFPPQAIDPLLRPHLAATAMVQSDDPRIRLRANLITLGSANAWEAARRLHNWVSREILPSTELGYASALEAFQRRRGDCTEKSMLLAAMARSVGIPARCVFGLIGDGEVFGRHMWTELWVGRWQPMDAGWNAERVGAGWIRLGVETLGLTDDLKRNNQQLLGFAAVRKVFVEELETEK
jgi:hypothetical protein